MADPVRMPDASDGRVTRGLRTGRANAIDQSISVSSNHTSQTQLLTELDTQKSTLNLQYSQARPLAEVHSASACSLASTMSSPVEAASAIDCGASIAVDSGFDSGCSVETGVSHWVTGRRDASDGLVEAGLNQYLVGDSFTATMLLSEAVGQQTNHALELEYGTFEFSSGISLSSQQMPGWMSGELAKDSPLEGIFNKRFENALQLMEAAPSLDKSYLICGSICCLRDDFAQAREFYRKGLVACNEKSQLRAALGTLNSLDRYIDSAVEDFSVSPDSKLYAAKEKAAMRVSRAQSVPSAALYAPVSRLSSQHKPSRSGSLPVGGHNAVSGGSNGNGSRSNGNGGHRGSATGRIESLMRRLGYKRDRSASADSRIPEEPRSSSVHSRY